MSELSPRKTTDYRSIWPIIVIALVSMALTFGGFVLVALYIEKHADVHMNRILEHSAHEETRCNKLAQAVDNLSADVRDLQKAIQSQK